MTRLGNGGRAGLAGEMRRAEGRSWGVRARFEGGNLVRDLPTCSCIRGFIMRIRYIDSKSLTCETEAGDSGDSGLSQRFAGGF